MTHEDQPAPKKTWVKPEIWAMKLNKREMVTLFGEQPETPKKSGSAAA